MAVAILAHRGGALNFPENTLAAFRGGAALGASGIECDVRRTVDGEFVLFHDSDARRLTGRPGPIEGLSWRQVRELRVLGREPVAHLDDLLEWLSGSPGVACWAELEVGTTEHAAEIARRFRDAHLESRCHILTFSVRRRLLKAAKAACPGIGISVMPLAPFGLVETAERAGAASLCVGWNQWPGTRAWFKLAAALAGLAGEVARASQRGLSVTGGVANTRQDIEWFAERGFAGVWTDDVRLAAEVLHA